MMLLICLSYNIPANATEEMPGSAWALSPVPVMCKPPKTSPPTLVSRRDKQILGVLSTKTAPGAGNWVLQGDAGQGKDLWATPAPPSPPTCNIFIADQTPGHPRCLPCSQGSQPGTFLLFPCYFCLSNSSWLLGRLASSLDITLSHPPELRLAGAVQVRTDM